jgi:integrase
MLFSLYHLRPPFVVRIAVGIQNVIYTPLIWNLFNVTDPIPVVKRTATAARRVCHRITSFTGKGRAAILQPATSFASAKEFFGLEPVSLIDEARIEAYKTWRLNENKVRDVTLRHDLHSLSKFFRYAITQHWTRVNPIHNVEIPSDEDRVRMHVLTTLEEQQYFKLAAKHRDLHDLRQLMLNQGPRPDEVASLLKTDVDLEHRKMHIRKGKSRAARRKLDLTAESCRILAERMASESPWIFPSSRNPGQHVARLNNAHDRLLNQAKKDGIDLEFVLYDFRHTFATRMAEEGIHLATLAKILGHNSIRIVERYIHPTDEHKKSAMVRYEADQMIRAAAGQSGRPN